MALTLTRHSFILLSSLLATALTAAAGSSYSSAADSTDVATRLREVTVTADRHSEEIVRPQILRGEELQRLNAHSVADAVRYFAGVQLKDYGGVGGVKTLDIRSMGSNHMGVFYDGLPLGNAQNGQIDLGKFSLDNIEEINLYNAQKSGIFQPARDFASSGSVYIRSRRPRLAPGRNTGGAVTMRAGSFGLANPSARFDWQISPAVSATVNAEYTYATGRYRFRYRKRLASGAMAWDTTAVRRNGDINAFRAEAGVFGQTGGASWMAKAYYYDSERGIPGAIVNNVWKNSQRQWDRNLFVQGQYRAGIGDKAEVMANAKYARDRMRYLNPDTTLMLIDNTFVQNETYVSVTARYALTGWWHVAAAADWQFNTLESDMAMFVHPVRHQLLTSVATAADYLGLRAQASLLLTEVWDRTRPHGGTVGHKHIDRLTPAVFVSWRPGNRHLPEVRAFWKKAFRMPTFNDLYYTDIGNSRLNPEGTTQYDVGATWQCDFTPVHVEVTADVYHNTVTDKIIAVPKGTGQYRWMMMNIGRVKVNGADVSCTTRLHLPGAVEGRLRLNYTYQQARDYTDPTDCHDRAGTYKGQIAYIPLHSGSVAAGLQWRNAELNYSWIYAGQRWDSSSNIPANHVEPWYTSDLSASWTQPLRSMSLRFVLEINNIANQQYEVIRNYPMPGRNFKFITTWTF